MNYPLKMKIAIISDVHGNSDALTAVLADIDSLGIDTILNLGDHFSGPLAARETASLLMSREMTNIRGNHDRLILELPEDEMGPSDLSAYKQLERHHIQWLNSLPSTEVINEEIFLCHGTPEDDLQYWMENVSAAGDVSLRNYSEIAAFADGIAFPLILCGHTHIPRAIKLSDGRQIVNPGSVGAPAYSDILPAEHIMQTGTPDACYAIALKEKAGWQVTFRHVPYDTTRMVELAKVENRMEWVSAVASGWIL